MKIPTDPVSEIKVNVDITADQVQPDSAQKLQVVLNYDTPVDSYTSPDGTIITGDNLVKKAGVTITSDDLKRHSEELGRVITQIQDQLDQAVAEKNTVDGLIPQVVDATETAVLDLAKAVSLDPVAINP